MCYVLTFTSQHRCHRPRIRNLPPPRDLPGLARRARRPHRLRHRHQTLPVKTSLASRSRANLHRVDIRARVRAMAAHGIGLRRANRAGLRQRSRPKRRRHQRHGPRLVQFRAAHHRHRWPARDDSQHSLAGSSDGRISVGGCYRAGERAEMPATQLMRRARGNGNEADKDAVKETITKRIQSTRLGYDFHRQSHESHGTRNTTVSTLHRLQCCEVHGSPTNDC